MGANGEWFATLLSISLVFTNYCYCIEVVSTAGYLIGGLGLSFTFAGYEYMKCRFGECCDDTWIKPNLNALDHALETELHGQHLVRFSVLRSLKGHLRNKNPKKALVMAFHGWTGCGKNHVSKIIAENLYTEGTRSKFVHWYIATHHFPHADEVVKYKDKLQHEIREKTKSCERSLFIFDEMDKMPPGVVDALKPYIDYHEQVDGVDYRKNIYIFLSNAGGNDITRVAFDFWLNGKDREEITLKDIEPIVNRGVFNEKGGLQHSEIIEKNLIDIYVPFLPLEKSHIIECIKDELRARSKTSSVISDEETILKIADQLIYSPPEFLLFSVSGCKKVSQKVDLYA